MFSFSLFLKIGISPGILDKARSLSAYLAKRHFTRHTWQSMFSFSLLLQKDISLGLLDKHVLFCKLAFYPVCLTKHALIQLVFCKTAFHPAYSTKITKHVLFYLVFTKRHFTRHTWQRWQNMFSFSLFLENVISPGIRQSMFSFYLFHQADLTKHVLFRLVFAQRHFTRHTLQKWQSMLSFSLPCKTAFHQAYLTKHVLF